MEVVSHGQYHTMSDCAVGDGESLYIGSGIYIDVTKMTADELEFEISGITQTAPGFTVISKMNYYPSNSKAVLLAVLF